MKKIILISAILLIITAVCRGQRQAGNDDIIRVDVRKSYSSKKELILQDFMDVEYIALETKDDFLNQGSVRAIGKEIILVKNHNNINDGNIFVYDRTGKALRKINHKGQGPEEYTYGNTLILDEDKGEIFVSDIGKRKIFVYDLYGKFKRSFNEREDGVGIYVEIFNYDRDNLICYYNPYGEEASFALISKQDGSITKEIKIPYEKKKDKSLNSKSDPYDRVFPGVYHSLIPYSGNWLLYEYSSDTVFTFLPDYSLRPFIIRTPSIQSMDPEVFLFLTLFSDRYYFMEAVKREYNFETRRGFPRTYFMYDKQEKAFFGYNVYNGDYSTQKEIYMNQLRAVNHEDAWQPLPFEAFQVVEAYQLVESYKKGELKEGKLKEIAAELDEEDNPVIMLVKHKK